ncbi:SapC family protein [uncultured Neptuniibacter sp.]|uniref:SapC family protein n=2 Tax=Neptuniibacter TaxID=459520 RepID=UPI0032B17A93|tara:strand:- start:3619 stop:4368 length:750 start_codon:yes stop_codon:yes gene_type:complete
METKKQMKPLFYNQIKAISYQNHHDCYVIDDAQYTFAKQTNSVPLSVAEFSKAGIHYPIVFLSQGEEVSPVAVIGLKAKDNVWVDESGQWLNNYVPAYIRRYPYIAIKTSENEYTLCIDESAEVVNRSQEGHPLFIGEEQSEYLQGINKFVEAYELEQHRNKQLSTLLLKFDLLESSQLTQKGASESGLLSGFQVVSRKRLESLDKDALAELHQSGAMELIFQHLFSLERFQSLTEQENNRDIALAEEE